MGAYGWIPFENTKPELAVQAILRKHNVPFRTHVKSISGWPDIVIDQSELIIMVHGCYWHRHDCPNGRKLPLKRRKSWVKQFEQRKLRDKRVFQDQKRDGWNVLVVWECDINERPQQVEEMVVSRLESYTKNLDHDTHTNPSVDYKSIVHDEERVIGVVMSNLKSNEESSKFIWLVYAILLVLVLLSGWFIAANAVDIEKNKQISSDLKDSLSELRIAVTAKRVELEETEKELTPLRMQLVSAKQILTTVDQKTAEKDLLTDQIGELKQEIINLQRTKYRESISIEQLTSETSETQRDLDRLKMEFTQQDGVNSGLRDRSRKLRSDIQVESNEFASIQYERAKAESLIDQRDSTKQELDALQIEKNNLFVEINGLSNKKNDLEDTRRNMVAVKAAIIIAEERERSLDTNSDVAEKTLKSLEARRSKLLAEIREFNDTKSDLKDARNSLAAKQAAIISAEEHKRDLDISSTAAEIDLNALGNKKSNLLAEISELSNTKSELEIARRSLAEVKAAIITAEERKRELEIRANGTEQALQTLENNKTELQKKILVYTKERDSLVQEIANEKVTLQTERLSSSLQTLIDTLNRLVNESLNKIDSDEVGGVEGGEQ